MSTREHTFAPMPGSRCAKCHAYADEHALADHRVAELEVGIRRLRDNYQRRAESSAYTLSGQVAMDLRALVGDEPREDTR
jgi:hypothetical protein